MDGRTKATDRTALCMLHYRGGMQISSNISGHRPNVYLNVYEDDALYHNLYCEHISFAIPLFARSSRHLSRVPFHLQSTRAHKHHCPNPSRHRPLGQLTSCPFCCFDVPSYYIFESYGSSKLSARNISEEIFAPPYNISL